jgi:hypothetical protein
MEKKINKNNRPYYKIILTLVGLKECHNPRDGKPLLCPLQAVTPG